MKILKSIYIIFPIFLIACIGGPSGPLKEELANADYGKFQTTEECKRVAENKIKSMLKDPITAVFNHNLCYKGYMVVTGLPLEFGYLQAGSVNSKDSLGEYTGFTGYKVLIKNNVAIRYCLVEHKYGYCGPKP